MHFNQNQSREIIMNHYMNPDNKVKLEENFITCYSNTCSDMLQLQTNWDNDILLDAKFDGHGCAVFMASTDIFLSLIKSKTKSEIKSLVELFTRFVNQEKLSDSEIEQLGDLKAFYNVKTHLNRVACALLTPNYFLND
ncbi:Fe-S cluster assembly sulfur transfer protein SufU [Mycoplasmopsis verecunda]|uniref:Nitrogen fixation protein NifU n=1 Tax=Mycoplasmopsis verecunda TaxID=171291 RepID=A0A1T4KEH2_9BACT|nr:SUF system NifU family Fe-S cluster assembly protein [Mycoplasmopsis verecunda]WPB54873.1 SUF system NifU family Fe-S cluster assembly protein [Mycoplasmopsis verecunda]SJZ40791.1 nitrogen fixation protein NifU [Mycoplasmopsis verecunda]